MSDRELGERLRAQGLRLTHQRERVFSAVEGLVHATPEEVAVRVAADGGPTMPASTVYRCLEVLEGLGLLAHTHLDHRAPSYSLADHADHLHLVCRGCGRVQQCPAGAAESMVGTIRAVVGFDADVTHMAIHGWCSECERPQ